MDLETTEKTQEPYIFCKEHTTGELQFANIDPDLTISSFPLACQVCLDNSQRNHLYVPIKEILENEVNKPILNWPRGINKQSIDFLESHSVNAEKELNEIRNQISQFYDEITESLVSQIKEQKKEDLMIIDQHELKMKGLINFYNQAFKRQEIKELFHSMDSFSSERYFHFLNSLEETRKRDLDELEKDIQWVIECEKGLRLKSKQSLLLKEQISKIITEMNLQFLFDSLEKSFSAKMRLQNQQLEINNNQSSNNQPKKTSNLQCHYDSLDELPMKPRRPYTGFFLYKAEVFSGRRIQFPNMKIPELVTKICEEYKYLDQNVKSKYEEQYRKEKDIYNKLMEAWKEKYGEIERQLNNKAKKALMEQKQQSRSCKRWVDKEEVEVEDEDNDSY